jgi:cell division protein FtsL
MRLLHVLVIAVLIFAASFVYKIKFDSTMQAERVAKLNDAIRKERNAIAHLRAEWAKLETPGRIQALAERHLKLQPVKGTQFDTLDNLPDRPPPPPSGQSGVPIGAMLTPAQPAEPASPEATGSIPEKQ